jgi:hypothetical protein
MKKNLAALLNASGHEREGAPNLFSLEQKNFLKKN